jgi:outer membrane protein assembly factor BamE (lipoprotein component of BamABCDE complex)
MKITGRALFNTRTICWLQRTGFLVFATILLSACARTPAYLYEAGERPIPIGIENEIHPKITTQDEVLAMLGEPVARLKSQTKDGHVHTWTYSYMALEGTHMVKGESLTITFDDKNFVVTSVVRGPI